MLDKVMLRLIACMVGIMLLLGYLTAMPVAGIIIGNQLLVGVGLLLGIPAHITAWIIVAIVRDTRRVTPGMRWIKYLIAIAYACGVLFGIVQLMNIGIPHS